MRSYIEDNALASTEQLLLAAYDAKNSFKPIHFIADTLILKLLSLPDYRGRMAILPKVGPLLSCFLEVMKGKKAEIQQHFHLKKLDWLKVEMSVSSMTDGDALARHADVNRFYGSNIELLFLLYFSSLPQKFSGGNLILHWPDGDEIVEPINNRFVIFPASLPHSVSPIVLEDQRFEYTRFAVVGRVIGQTTLKEYCYRGVNKTHRLTLRILRKTRKILKARSALHHN